MQEEAGLSTLLFVWFQLNNNYNYNFILSTSCLSPNSETESQVAQVSNKEVSITVSNNEVSDNNVQANLFKTETHRDRH